MNLSQISLFYFSLQSDVKTPNRGKNRRLFEKYITFTSQKIKTILRLEVIKTK